jgi:hypothetical protein
VLLILALLDIQLPQAEGYLPAGWQRKGLQSGVNCRKIQLAKRLALAARLPYHRRRTGGRVVDGTALEMRRACKGSVGSNPTLSAIKKGPLRALFYGGLSSVNDPPVRQFADRRFGREAKPSDPSVGEEYALTHIRAIPPCRGVRYSVLGISIAPVGINRSGGVFLLAVRNYRRR